MIIVTGASGKLGRAIVEKLLERVPAEQMGVSVREVDKARDLADRGVRVRRGDFDDSESLLDAFEGASQVLLVSSGILGEAGIRQHRNAINAVKKSGAARILYTSHMGSSRASLFPPMLHHAATEELLEQSGMPFTSLRNGFYASSLLWLISDAITSGELLLPEDGPFAWTTHSDLAEAAAAMVSQRPWDGMSPNLTASEAFDMEEVAAMTSNIIGRPIRRIVVSDEEYKERLSAQGVPEFRLEIAMGMFLASRRGEFAKTSTALANLIGRPPVKLSNFLKEAITAPNL